MFGIDDPGIWLAYLLAFACVIFAIWFGVRNWNKDENDSINSKNLTSEYVNLRYNRYYIYVFSGLSGLPGIQGDKGCQ